MLPVAGGIFDCGAAFSQDLLAALTAKGAIVMALPVSHRQRGQERKLIDAFP